MGSYADIKILLNFSVYTSLSKREDCFCVKSLCATVTSTTVQYKTENVNCSHSF